MTIQIIALKKIESNTIKFDKADEKLETKKTFIILYNELTNYKS